MGTNTTTPPVQNQKPTPNPDVFVIGRGKAQVPIEQVENTSDVPTPNQRTRIVDGVEKKYGYFSYSSLTTFSKCSALYYWQYLSGLRRERAAPKMWLGSSLHSSLEKAFLAKIANTAITAEDLKIEMSRVLESSVQEYEQQVSDAKARGEELAPIDWGERITCQADFDRLGRDLLDLFMKDWFPKTQPLAVEKLFNYPFQFKNIPGSVSITGFIDLIEDCNGEQQVVDFKSGRKRTQQDVDTSEQLTLYSMAEGLPSVAYTSLVLGSTGGRTPARARPPEILKLSARRTIREYERVHSDFENLMLSIRDHRFARTGLQNMTICGPTLCQFWDECCGSGCKK